MNTDTDTIAAIAAAGSEGCICIVRLSGPNCFHIVDTVTRSAENVTQSPGNRIIYAHVVGDDGGDIDEVILLAFRGPKSYTCEDMIEIQGHGGKITAGRILRRCLECGARAAEPGEFTKRAFLNGRIDLIQAEAVQDLVKAHSEQAAKMALEQLEGSLSRKINQLYDSTMEVATDLEATLDFSEEQLLSPVFQHIKERINMVIKEIRNLVENWFQGHVLRDGASVVIMGRPNVGKSTLLNKLLDKDRAIVSPIPGTTRDTIEESLILNGIPLRLVDTAGMRDTSCTIEQEGIERMWKNARQADLVLFVLDASAEPDEEHGFIRQHIQNKNVLYVVNKIDIKRYDYHTLLAGAAWVETSLVKTNGVQAVKEKIVEYLRSKGLDRSQPGMAISERHRFLLHQAGESLKTAQTLLARNEEENTLCAAEQVREAIGYLGEMTGRLYHDELLNRIFSRFCIGK